MSHHINSLACHQQAALLLLSVTPGLASSHSGHHHRLAAPAKPLTRQAAVCLRRFRNASSPRVGTKTSHQVFRQLQAWSGRAFFSVLHTHKKKCHTMVFGFGKRTQNRADLTEVVNKGGLAQLAAQADGQFAWQPSHGDQHDSADAKAKEPLPYKLQQHKVTARLKVSLLRQCGRRAPPAPLVAARKQAHYTATSIVHDARWHTSTHLPPDRSWSLRSFFDAFSMFYLLDFRSGSSAYLPCPLRQCCVSAHRLNDHNKAHCQLP